MVNGKDGEVVRLFFHGFQNEVENTDHKKFRIDLSEEGM